MCQEAVYPVPPEPSLLNPHCKWSLPLPNCKKRNRVSPHTTVRCRRLVFICSLLPPTHPQLPLYPAGRLSAPVAVCCVSLGLLRSRGPHRIRWARELLGNLGEGRRAFRPRRRPDACGSSGGWKECWVGSLGLQQSSKKGSAVPTGSVSQNHPVQESCVLLK